MRCPSTYRDALSGDMTDDSVSGLLAGAFDRDCDPPEAPAAAVLDESTVFADFMILIMFAMIVIAFNVLVGQFGRKRTSPGPGTGTREGGLSHESRAVDDVPDCVTWNMGGAGR